jgi:hypothetical protein
MALLQRLALLSVFLLLSACSQFEQLMHSQEPVSHVDKLVSEQQFQRALDFMGGLPEPRSQAVVRRYKKLQLQAIAYEKAQLDEASKAADTGAWLESLAILDQAQVNYSSGQALGKLRRDIYQRQQTDLQQTWLRLNRQQARVVPEQLASVKRLLDRGDASDQSRDLKSFYLQQARRLADFFAGQAAQEQAKKQWRLALEYYQLAEKMLLAQGRAAQYQSQIVALQKRLASPKPSKVPYQDLLARFYERLEAEELLRAKRVLSDIQRLYPERDNGQQQLELDERLEQRVGELTSAGREVYARGELDAAISLWQRALALRPEDVELRKLLGRAEAFKAHYEKLKQAEESPFSN